MKVEIKNLEKDSENPRLVEKEENIDNLVASFKAHHKFLHPPEIREKTGDPYKYWVYQGWHRVLAAKKLGLKEIECNLLNKSIEGIHLDLATEDKQRKDYNYWERGELYSKIIKEQGFSEHEYAKRYGMSQAMVAKCIKIHDKIPETRAMMIHSESSYQLWMTIADLEEENQKKVVEGLMVGSNISEKEVLEVISKSNSIKGIIADPNKSETTKQQLLDAFEDKLFTYQVPNRRAVYQKMVDLGMAQPYLEKVEIPFEKGQTEEQMQQFAKKLGGRYLGEKHFWKMELDKVKYEESLKQVMAEDDKAEYNELRKKEVERKEKERKMKEVEKDEG